YIAIGTNMGDRLANYRKAAQLISELPETRLTRRSSLYETEPHGRARNWFLNGVVEIETELDARELLKALQKIEAALGRKRTKKTASVSRAMDLDILLYDAETIESRNLVIPHPELQSRRFVLLPLSELAPAYKHPTLAETISALLVACSDDKKVHLFKQ
ncbi:MAG TPA: 2-amino-4-hydroxy-6-hydroxymethyldihydropteridine diphosphokinase, partial [Vicinamibacterales bacterium]|nr:2-amino-4-hydroxy-6-hydroxymethyldihydropteridine diphosphokinase [Vicinamibacterales bacterium]